MDGDEDQVEEDLHAEADGGEAALPFDLSDEKEVHEHAPDAHFEERKEEQQSLQEVRRLPETVNAEHQEEEEGSSEEEWEGPFNDLIASPFLVIQLIPRYACLTVGRIDRAGSARRLAHFASLLLGRENLIHTSRAVLQTLILIEVFVLSRKPIAAIALSRLAQIAGPARKHTNEVDVGSAGEHVINCIKVGGLRLHGEPGRLHIVLRVRQVFQRENDFSTTNVHSGESISDQKGVIVGQVLARQVSLVSSIETVAKRWVWNLDFYWDTNVHPHVSLEVGGLERECVVCGLVLLKVAGADL